MFAVAYQTEIADDFLLVRVYDSLDSSQESEFLLKRLTVVRIYDSINLMKLPFALQCVGALPRHSPGEPII